MTEVPIKPPLERLPDGGSAAVTPRTAMRIALLGVFALALFAAVFFRLWFLEILSGDHYLARANDNRVREIKVEAPRGEIIDRRGSLLVGNRSSLALRLDLQRVPAGPERMRLYRRVARLLGVSEREIRHNVQRSLTQSSVASPALAKNVKYRDIVAVVENQERYPGVSVSQNFVRSYPRGELGAHLFGFVREISDKQLESKRFENAQLGDGVGQDGLEFEYDKFLRGKSGVNRVQVDAANRTKGVLRGQPPEPGARLRLSIDRSVQQTGENALVLAGALARSNGNAGKGGAFVAMNVRNGEILGMGSAPTFNPKLFTGPISQATSDRLFRSESAPYTNRATASAYPAGSTFKPITAIAGLESGLITPGTVVSDNGRIKIGNRYFQNAGRVVNGPVALRRAMSVSSDVYFYLLGQRAYNRGGLIIQRWAQRFGLGRSTGVDLPGEAPGVIPSPAWAKKQQPYRYNGVLVKPQFLAGNNVNLAVGQDALSVTPLQMAVVYSAIANGGFIVQPHVGLRVEARDGRVVQEIKPGARRKVNVSANYRRVVLEGLRDAASAAGGTSADVFRDFPVPVAGKTGTAQTPKGDQSWYIALAPYPNPQYVVATTIEQGGFGAEAAAPAARLILADLLNVKLKKRIVEGSSQTR